MDEHKKKKIAPIIITIILLSYYAIYFGFFISVVSFAYKMILGILPLVLGSVTIYVCYERIKEIDGGEEDDLSKY